MTGAILGLSEKYLRETTFAGNSLWAWLISTAVFALVWAVARTFHRVLSTRLSRLAKATSSEWDDVAADVVGRTGWFFHFALAVLLASRFLDVTGEARLLQKAAVVLSLALQIGLWGQEAAGGVTRVWMGAHDGGHAKTVAAGIRFIARLVIWGVVVVVALSNLGIEVSAVIAGLGVGGIAAALAVQGILGDLFAGLSMYFDRPFDIGDFVVVDAVRGTVDRIGLRTTRVRSLDGEQITIANGDLVKSRIKNMSRIVERRVVLRIGVEYGTSVEKVEKVRDILRDVIGARPLCRLDRAHFVLFGASALEFEAVYFVQSPVHLDMMDEQETINLEVMRRLQREEVAFAFPTQTIHVGRRHDARRSDPGLSHAGGRG